MSEQDKLYEELINRGPVVLYTRQVGKKWGFTFIGENSEGLFGIKHSDVLADIRYWQMHVHPDDLDGILAKLAHIEPGRYCFLQYRFQHLDGSYIWIGDDVVLMNIAGHRYFIGSLRNITESKQAENSLIDNIKHYSRVSDNVRDMVLQVDLQGIAYYASPSHQDVLGISAEDMVGMNAYDLVHPEDIEKILPIIRESIASRKPAKFEYRSRHGDGHYFWTEANANPLVEKDGSISGAILVTRDITEKKEAEDALRKAHDRLEEKVRERTVELLQTNAELKKEIKERNRTGAKLRESEERYRSIVENTHDGIVIVDEDFRVVYANPEMGLISGYDIEEELGRDFTVFLDEKSRTKAKKLAIKRRQEDDVPSVYEVILIRKDGDYRTGEVRISLFKDSTGKHLSVVHFLDITGRKYSEKILLRQKQELENKNRELEDINTALNVLLNQRSKDKGNLEENIMANVNGLIIPYIEKIKRGPLDERMRSCLATIETNLFDIVSSFSRQLSSKYTKLTPREIQIASLIKEGRDSKEIAGLLDLSPATIEFHRNNLRKKLRIRNEKINLRSYLLSLK
jgi:PAS domain S-box-containing protein